MSAQAVMGMLSLTIAQVLANIVTIKAWSSRYSPPPAGITFSPLVLL